MRARVIPNLVLLLLWGSSGSAADRQIWFNHGLAPLESGAGSDLSAADCRSCHQEIYQDWSRSRHAQSWTNPIFQEGVSFERTDRCIYCHAPLQEQFAEVKSRGAIRLAAEGVNCATCHIRDGRIYSSKGSGTGFHPFYREPRLKDPKFCAGCHQFNFLREGTGSPRAGALSSQNTYMEWLEYRKSGGKKSCQDCHMPGGRHVFQGAHEVKFLTDSVTVSALRVTGGYEFTITPQGVGHRLPTGDLFRYLTLEVASGDSKDFKTVSRFGRVFRTVRDPPTGNHVQELQGDTSIGPFEKRKVHVSLKGPLRYRMVYHYTSPVNEIRSLLGRSELVETVLSGTLE